jgi:hypothetical protein
MTRPLAVGLVLATVLALADGLGEAGSELAEPTFQTGEFTVKRGANPGPLSPAAGRSDQRVPAPSRPAKSSPPLALQAPPEPSSVFDGTNLKKVPAERLEGVARRLYDDKQYLQAIQLLHYAIQGGADGGYDLACDYALAKSRDADFYWLQKSALDEGVDAVWAAEDRDLKIFGKGARWSRIAPYLAAYNAYWAGTGHHTSTLVVPTGYKPGKPVGVLVGMNGKGADPEGFVSNGAYQELYTRADAEFAKKAGSRVELKLYEGIKEHAFPADARHFLAEAGSFAARRARSERVPSLNLLSNSNSSGDFTVSCGAKSLMSEYGRQPRLFYC